MSAPRDPPEWGVGVGCVGSDHGLLGLNGLLFPCPSGLSVFVV